MARLSRQAPLTPLDALRDLLEEYSDGDVAFPSRLAQILQTSRKQVLPELGRRLAPDRSPRGLRRALLATCAKTDWPEWVPWIQGALLEEPDLGVFDEGCAALGALGTRDSLLALQELQRRRSDPDHQVVLARELGLFQSPQPVSHHLNRLMEGQRSLRLAAQGAKLLAAVATEAQVPALGDAFRDGDPVTQQLALRVLGSLPFEAAGEFLLAQADQLRQDLLEQQTLVEELRRLQSLPRPSVLPELLRRATERFAPRDAPAVAALKQAAGQEEGGAQPALEALRACASGSYEGFLLDALTLATEGKVARYSSLLAEAAPQADARLAHLAALCDQACEALAYKVDTGTLDLDRALPRLSAVLLARVGGEGVIHACLRHLPASATALLDELLADPDLARRTRYLNALGAREDDALAGFFMKAAQDPIVEVGHLALHHLGKLKSSFPMLMAMFQSGQVEQIRLALGAFRENRTRLAAEPLLEFLRNEGPDPLLVDAVEAVSAIGYPASAPVLLELLHDGKPLNLQLALARALKQLGTETASLGLLAKAAALKQPQVLILALEGSLQAFASFDRPLPADQLPALLQLLDRCCDDREGEGQRLPAVLACQGLFVFDRGVYEKLKDRFSDFLFDLRTKETWDRDSNDRVAAVIKELARRGDGLGLLSKKEAAIRGMAQSLPAAGPKRIEALLALREALQDPDLIVRPELAREMAALVLDKLRTPAAEWRETAHLCEIGGLTRQAEALVEPIREVYRRATGLGLKSAARTALLALGLTEDDLNRRAPIRSILVLEPSAFFRRRLASTLAALGRWELEEAGGRAEAEAILARRPVDLVLTESKDADGDLSEWLERQWTQGRCRNALLSTASRDVDALAGAPWVIGTLFKPYPVEQVLQTLSD
jgi:hypothetical protein